MQVFLVGATIGLWVLLFTLLVFPALLTSSVGHAHRNVDTPAKPEERTGATGGARHRGGRGSVTAAPTADDRRRAA